MHGATKLDKTTFIIDNWGLFYKELWLRKLGFFSKLVCVYNKVMRLCLTIEDSSLLQNLSIFCKLRCFIVEALGITIKEWDTASSAIFAECCHAKRHYAECCGTMSSVSKVALAYLWLILFIHEIKWNPFLHFHSS